MSSFERADDRSLFVVQTGIAAWEDPRPIADWRWKTVSIVSKERSSSIALLQAVVASRPARMRHVQRLYLAPLPPSITDTQRRRLLAELGKDPPGFSDTTLSAAEDRICVTSALRNVCAVDPRFLTDYRRCALIEFEDFELERIHNLCREITGLSGSGINVLLGHLSAAAVVRVLEMETHAVVQLLGATAITDLAVGRLVEYGIKQFHDLRTLPRYISSEL